MKTLFVIGGIGSGKSTVAQLFEEQGLPKLDLDKVGHEVLLFPEVRDELVGVFGEDILDESDQIVRSALAAKAFASPADTEKLTNITSKRIVEELKRWLTKLEEKQAPCAVVEVSAFDGPDGFYGGFASEIVAVVAPVEVRIERAVERGFERSDVLRRIDLQATDQDRRTWAQYVIENDGSIEDLRKQVEDICEQINS